MRTIKPEYKSPGFRLLYGHDPIPGHHYDPDGILEQDDLEYLAGTGAFSNDPAEVGPNLPHGWDQETAQQLRREAAEACAELLEQKQREEEVRQARAARFNPPADATLLDLVKLYGDARAEAASYDYSDTPRLWDEDRLQATQAATRILDRIHAEVTK